ncbi:phosphoribosylaminoimidazole-succinocarboxamide synthase [Candidatus Magnetobacterium bavaricum]|uniref:Phosphoribosylaminoimidazole-succinocarboxamide synthase n=1 Tax=Candidatus Magnetobacterium bavaricum TaxID=29290 RepID=A0A0F3GQK3_9BACT|nr:phosphoribosylaminoimidazole-succinocarboxamide synthase [Candidatus Magnetobacterium bavaricum]
MTANSGIVLQTDVKGLKLIKRGKVRDIYDCSQHLLMVVTDRLSAFDVVLPSGIPSKGEILTRLSVFWFSLVQDIISNHLVSTDVNDFPGITQQDRAILGGRTMLVKKATPLPVECIVRGYITGSGWKDYRKSGSICGIPLLNGLQESQRLPQPIFTPSTKADTGHDINISFEETVSIVGKEMAETLMQLSIDIYNRAASHALSRGIIIADTKFEFGLCDDKLILIDEVLTPDSSRFWPARDYAPGRGQDSFDKQIVRDYLLTLDWTQTYPGPPLPDDIVAKTADRYRQILEILTSPSGLITGL